MLSTFARLEAKTQGTDRWQNWTAAVQRTESMNFDKQEKYARRNCHEQAVALFKHIDTGIETLLDDPRFSGVDKIDQLIKVQVSSTIYGQISLLDCF